MTYDPYMAIVTSNVFLNMVVCDLQVVCGYAQIWPDHFSQYINISL